tara:strand:+ start:1117 stop:2019 length:903 start_codon:yes stop_codon:yes gene_type:complete
MKRLVIIIITSFFMSSCFFKGYGPMTETHYELESQDLARKNLSKEIKNKHFLLGWITLPPLDENKNIQINTDRNKYKLISTEYVEDETLLKVLSVRNSEIYYDFDSITKLYNDSGKVFKIKILKNYNYQSSYVSYTVRRSLLSNYEISCGSKNKLKLIDEMWWNGSWFQGIRYTWNDKGTQIRNSFPEAGDIKDYKWMEEYNSLLCDVVNNKNRIKAATWLKNADKRKAKLREEKERKAKKAKKEKERKAKKIQQEKERKAKKVREDKRRRDLDKASQTCLDLGFKKGTKKYKECIIELL